MKAANLWLYCVLDGSTFSNLLLGGGLILPVYTFQEIDLGTFYYTDQRAL